MKKLNKLIEFLICIEVIFLATFVPYNIAFVNKDINLTLINFPITFQVTCFIVLTFLFSGNLVIKAHITYLIIGLFFIPIFYGGGSLGYLLTPNFGYLLGIFPLVRIINTLNKKEKINIPEIFRTCLYSLIIMHFVGISYLSIQSIMFDKLSLIPYNISLFSLSKMPYEIVALIPTVLIIKLINNFKIRI